MATRAKAKPPARKPGRPSKYKEDTAEQAAKLCALGATDAELADFFKVAISTISLWKVEHGEFSEALKGSKDVADDRVQQSLYRRAVGFVHDETDIRVIQNRVVKTPLRKHYPPDTVAAIFWLKNRRPEQWRAQPEEGGGDAPPPVTINIGVVDSSIPEPG